MTVTEEFARWASELEFDEIPMPVRHAVSRHLLDGTGAALGAHRHGDAHPALAVALGLGGPAEAAYIGGRVRIGAPAAALASGVLVHALDFDDTHPAAIVHPTAAVLPAAFAVGQQVRASGAEVVTAALIGYELACRIGAASPHGFHAQGLHATGVAGTLAAACVSGRLQGFAPAQLVNALGVAGSSSGGLMEFLSTGSSTKTLHPGLASHAGVLAARLAAAGAEGPASILEGDRGLFAALSARESDPALITRDLGTRWEVLQIHIKRYPSCALMHSALDAVAALPAPAEQLVASRRLEIRLHSDALPIVAEPRAAKLAPRTPYEAKFSLPWSAAALLLDGRISANTYSHASLQRPEIRELARRVCIVDDGTEGSAIDAVAAVTAELPDGRTVRAVAERPGAGSMIPVSDADLVAKLRANAGGDPGVTSQLTRRLLDLANEQSLEPLHALAGAIADDETPLAHGECAPGVSWNNCPITV